MEPSVSRGPKKLRISYDVPHRIFSADIYPLQAPNGSTIVIYGHEQGLRIIWRGGRSFRPAQVPVEKPQVNGSSKEDAMVLDSDDEEPAPAGLSSIDDFNVDDEECDLSEPYQRVIRHIDVHTGTSVRHIAFPRIPHYLRDSPPGAFPAILVSKIVVSAACSDNSIRLITLPLLPPFPSVDGSSYKAVQTVTIAGINTHQEVPSSIAITQSAYSDASNSRRDSSKSRSRSRTRTTEGENASTTSHQSGKSWCFLLISISATAGGLMLTHQISITSDTSLSSSPEDLYPVQRCYLGFPCMSSKVVFSPCAFPADRHSTILLSAPDSGFVKVYQVSSNNLSNTPRGRRDSAATTDSASSGLLGPSGSAVHNGRFLTTLYPGFMLSPTSSSLQRRKRILDVAWIAAGRAIVVLLEDGEWGVWDLEGVGPGSGSADLLQGQSNIFGIQGGAMTKFAFKSLLTSATEVLPKTQKSDLRDTKDKNLAPMTPHTRRTRSDGLFAGGNDSLVLQRKNAYPVRGQICVTEHAPSSNSALATPEESVVLVHGFNIIFVPSLQALWRAQTSSKGTFDAIDAIRPSQFPCTLLGQGSLISVAELPSPQKTKTDLLFSTKTKESPDLLVVADHRLILFVSPLSESTSAEGLEARFPFRLGKASEATVGNVSDQVLLRQGQLDLEGMDRVLEGMGHEGVKINGNAGSLGKGVDFDLEDDLDMSMTSPTPKSGSRSKPTPGRSIGRKQRPAFS